MRPETDNNSRRGFLKGLAAMLGGVGVFSLMSTPAQARSRWRGGYGYGGFGYPVYRVGSHRRFYGGGYPGYYGGGYNSYYGAPSYYGGGYNYIVPAPVVPVRPYYSGGYYGPIMKRDAVRAIDALSLLEA